MAIKERKSLNSTLILIVLSVASMAQVPCGFNADVETGTFIGWTGSTGTCINVNCNTFIGVPGLVPPANGLQGRHTIVSGTGREPMSCNTIPKVCPWGGNYSIKLGNDDVSFETEDLMYTYTVSASNPILVYAYAVLLEDPNHPDSLQPAFKSYVMTQSGSIIPCTYFKVNATNMRGYQSCTNPWQGTQVWYKNWRNVAVDLSAYAGQQVTVYFQTNDCGYGAHFGMAYIDIIGCYPKQITVSPCVNNQPLTITAPYGYLSYNWSNGMTGQTITVPATAQTLTVTMVSENGCQVRMTASTINIVPVINFANTIECICKRPTMFFDYTWSNDPIVAWSWTFGDGGISTLMNPSHQYPAAAWYTCTLMVTTSTGCTSIRSRTVQVNPCPIISLISHN